jgi:hypothetical protein
MFHPERELTPFDIFCAPGNKNDDVHSQCQRYWILEALRYTHCEAINALYKTGDHPEVWPQFPTVQRLSRRKTPHYGLGPILENESTISGTYKVIDNLFIKQLGLNPVQDFDGPLYLVYGDQKTVSLVRTVQKERQEAALPYDKLNWLLAIPGLFHWRTNFIDMVHELYGGFNYPTMGSTLYNNQTYLGRPHVQSSPFHQKEETALRAFDARVTAMFYQLLPDSVSKGDKNQVNAYIKRQGAQSFLKLRGDVKSSKYCL